jgi:glycosyltransferase involved in cell wall biosynthesis
MKLSILIPVHNEEKTIARVLERVLTAPLPTEVVREVVVIDDGSTDSSTGILETFHQRGEIILIQTEENHGKGGAIKTGLPHATGDFILIQDADEEYDPHQYEKLITPILTGKSKVVFGSRHLQKNTRNKYAVGNVAFTKAFNALFGTKLTDLATCYKVFPRSLVPLCLMIPDDDFAFDVFGLTITLVRNGYDIHEVPINYTPRNHTQGKHLRMSHGVKIAFRMAGDFFLRGGRRTV